MADRELLRRYRNYDTNELRLRLGRKRMEFRNGFDTQYQRIKADKEIKEMQAVLRMRYELTPRG